MIILQNNVYLYKRSFTSDYVTPATRSHPVARLHTAILGGYTKGGKDNSLCTKIFANFEFWDRLYERGCF